MWVLISTTLGITHSILINLFIKLGLNVFSVPPLVSILFVPTVFLAQRLQVSGGNGKAKIFFCSADNCNGV